MSQSIPLRPSVSISSAPLGAAPVDQETIFKVELDDRCFVFPDGKQLAHILVSLPKAGGIAFDAVFGFNKTRLPSRILLLELDEARQFVRELIDAIYAAKPAFVLTESIRITINVVANGYRLEFLRSDKKQEIFLSTSVIWRFVKVLLMAVDEASPVVAN
jgi:hypothetical protein